MKRRRLLRSARIAVSGISAAFICGMSWAYTVPLSTPAGITLVDVSQIGETTAPALVWRRLGDEHGNPLYTYDTDQSGRSSCYAACAQEFPPYVAGPRAKAIADFSIIVRDDHVRQWAYQGRPLYRYSGTDPDGEPFGGRFAAGDLSVLDPASTVYSPKHGWRRAAYTPEKSVKAPPTVRIDALAVANGFGLVDTASGKAIYAAPVSHKLSNDWRPVRAPALALPIGDFAIVHSADHGTRQWTYKGAALYTYSGDYAAGEVNGIFAGDKRVQAALVFRNFLPAGLQIGQYVGRGPLMTTAQGRTIYYVTRYHGLYGGLATRTGYSVTYNEAKMQGVGGCQAECTDSWKPVLAPANAQAQGFWEVVRRSDGVRQWAFKGSPVYSFVGDKIPGDIAGNNRSAIVYGGAQGEVAYADAGVDPSYQQARFSQVDRALALNDVQLKKATGKGVAKMDDADPTDQAGAGFYWHTVSLFY